MSKISKTPVPLLGSKTKTPVPVPATRKSHQASPESKKKNAQLSQEFVGDSDDSSDEASAKPGAEQKKAPINIAVHRPKTNGATKPTTEVKKKQNDISKKAARATVAPKNPEPKQVLAGKESAESSSSSDESSDDAETDIKQAQRREAQPKAKEDSDSSSDSASEESDEEAVPAAPQASEREARSSHAQTHAVAFQQALPYVPPEDFKPLSTERAASSPETNLFKNLEGKQIWHITAPEGVSLKDLKQLAMDKARNGEAILEHKGSSYGLSPAETGAGERQVIIPVPTGYKSIPAPISQSFHLHQVINLPKLKSRQADQSTGSAAASITASTVKAAKPQVKGLKMRFFPSGFEGSAPTTLGYSDSEDDTSAPQPAGLGIPKGFDPPAKQEKRKHEQANGEDEAEVPAKKHKKHRSAEEQARRDEKKAKRERKKQEKSKS